MPTKPRWDLTLLFRGPDGQLCANVLHYTGAAPGGLVDVEQDAEEASGIWAAIMKPVITTECRFEGVWLRYISAGQSWFASSITGNGPGTVTGDTLPAESSVIFQKLGNGPAKRASGTLFLPCVPEAYVDNSYVNPTGAAAYGPILTQLTSTLAAGPQILSPVVMSRVSDTLFPIVAARQVRLLGHQRRRRPDAF